MTTEFVKQCPYCQSINSKLIFNQILTRMVSMCVDCGYHGSTIFKDVERKLALAQIKNK